MSTRRGFLGLLGKSAAAVPTGAIVMGTLDAPAPEASNIEQCWVRAMIDGELDAEQLTKAKRRGWKPRLIDGQMVIRQDLVLCQRTKA